MRQVETTIGLILARIGHAHRKCAAEALSGYGLFPMQELVLLQLCEQDGISQTQIAERLEIEAPTVSKTLKKMEGAGLITRRTDSEDARVMRIFLTAKGRLLEQHILDIWTNLETLTLEGLTDMEQIVLRRLLLQVQQNLSMC